MNALIDFQAILGRDGRPEFFVVPADVFERVRPLLEAEASSLSDRQAIPQAVVEAHVLHDVPLVRAWREHLGLTQTEVALRAGLQQPALARLESTGAKPRKPTLDKLAAAMGLTVAQLLG